MKTLEQRKAELLDDLMMYYQYRHDRLRSAYDKWRELNSDTPKQKDPLAIDVFKGQCGSRIINAAWDIAALFGDRTDEIQVENMRLSEMPTLSEMKKIRNVGRKSVEYYKDTMTEYGYTDKLQ